MWLPETGATDHASFNHKISRHGLPEVEVQLVGISRRSNVLNVYVAFGPKRFQIAGCSNICILTFSKAFRK